MYKVEHPTCLGGKYIVSVSVKLNLEHSESPCLRRNGVDIPTVMLEMQVDIIMKVYGML